MLKNYSLLILLAIGASACHSSHRNSDNQTQPVAVVVTRIKLNNQQQGQLSLSATTEADHLVNLGFLVAGRVGQVNFEEGQYINKGQLIATVEPADYKFGLAAADADLNKANDEFRRLKIMYDRGSLTPSDYQTAIKSVEQAKAQQQSQLKRVKDTRLYAPISGLLARRAAEPGMVVGQGTPVFTIVDVQPIKVSASVPESELGQVAPGMKTKVHIIALDSVYQGTVALIGAVADPTTRAYSVKITLSNNDRKIRPGMVADVELSSKQKARLLTIPGEAVLHDASGATYVFVVDEQKHKAFKRKVTVGNVFDSAIQITSGLNNQEMIVTGGQQKLNDGADVQFNQPAQ